MKLVPAMVLAVVNFAADPVVFWFSVGTRAAGIVPEVRRDAEWLGNLAAGIVPEVRRDAEWLGNLAAGIVPAFKLPASPAVKPPELPVILSLTLARFTH